jgi:hypothetical protein
LNKYKFNGIKVMTESKFKRVTLGFSSFLIILAASLFSYGASAQVLTIPNTFTAGEPAVAADVNANFDAVATAVNGQVSTADVMTFFLPDETAAAGDVVGTAELTRHAAGVYLTADTTMLDADGAYTLWWIIFNNPAACDPAGCTGDDFGTAAVEASVMNATGRLADATGNATFNAFLPVGFMHTNPSSGAGRQLFGSGLQNVAGAVIHIVIRAHGPSTGNIEQLSTVGADCVHETALTGCYDAQAIVFPDPM